MMPLARSTCAALSLSLASAPAAAALRSSARLFACCSAACIAQPCEMLSSSGWAAAFQQHLSAHTSTQT